MARDISTRLILDGEAEYRNSLKQISQEWKTVQSALKVCDSDMKLNGQTTENLKAKITALQQGIETQTQKLNLENQAYQQARQIKEQYAKAAEDARARLEALKNSTSDADKTTKEYKDKLAAAVAEVQRYEQAEQKAEAAMNKHAQGANNAQTTINNLTGEINRLSQAEGDASNGMNNLGQTTQSAADAMASAIAAMGIAQKVSEIKDAILECVNAAAQWESAMMAIQRTTGMSDESLAQMGKEIQDLTLQIPITANEFAGIVEVASHLGIAEQDLTAFSQTMAQLATTTSMTSDQAATMLAQFASITGMDSRDYDKLGAALVALGVNFATNETKITEFSLAMAGAGANAGMTEAEIMALGTAVTSMGIEAGTGGNNMSVLVSSMQKAVETGKDLDQWAQICGMSAAQFAATFRNDAAGAILAFVQGLAQSNEPMGVLLSNIGITNQRATRMVTSLVNAERASGTLSKAIATANSAWSQNTALTERAAKTNSTAAASMHTYQNAVTNLKTAIGDALLPAMKGLYSSGQDIVEWATEIISENPVLVQSLSVVAIGIGATTAVLTAYVAISKIAKAVTVELNTAVKKSPWGLVAVMIGSVASALAVAATKSSAATQAMKTLRGEIDEGVESYKKSTTEIQENDAKVRKAIETVFEFADAESLTASQQRDLENAIGIINELLPEMGLEYDSVTHKINKSREEIERYADAAKNSDDLTAAQDRLEVVTGQLSTARETFNDAKKELDEYINKATSGVVKDYESYKEMIQNDPLITDENLIQLGQSTKFQQLLITYNDAAGVVGELDAEYQQLDSTIKTLKSDYDEMGADPVYVKQQQIAVDTLINEYNAFAEAFNETRKAIRGTLDDTLSGFDKVTTKAATSYSKAKAGLQSQLKWQEDYMKNFNGLLGRNIEGIDEFAARYADGSAQSANYLAAFAKMSDKQLAEIVAMSLAVDANSESMSTDLAKFQTGYDAEMAKLEQRAADMAAKLNAEVDTVSFQPMVDQVQAVIDIIHILNGMTVMPKLGSLGTGGGEGGGTPGEYATGLDYVPYNEFPAYLHKGEMVLTEAEARAYRAERRLAERGSSGAFNGTVVNGGDTVVNLTVCDPSPAYMDYMFDKFNVRMAGVTA